MRLSTKLETNSSSLFLRWRRDRSSSWSVHVTGTSSLAQVETGRGILHSTHIKMNILDKILGNIPEFSPSLSPSFRTELPNSRERLFGPDSNLVEKKGRACIK